MSWIIFYLLALVYSALILIILISGKGWTQRIALSSLVTLPVVWYCWDYFLITAAHAAMCEQEGGLRIITRPEKVEQVRWVGPDFNELTAWSTLETYYPRAQRVEIMTDNRGPDGRRLKHYVAYTAAPNPRAGLPLQTYPWKERPLTYFQSRVDALDPMYEISLNEALIPNGRRIVLALKKDGKVYATHTQVTHWWKGINYPDAVPTWHCPGPGTPWGRDQIRDLIFKGAARLGLEGSQFAFETNDRKMRTGSPHSSS